MKVFGAIWHYDSIQLGSRIGGKVYPRYLQNCWGVHFMHGRHNWQYTRDHNSWLLVMDQNLTDDYFSESGVNVGVSLRNTNNEQGKSNKCNQCNYASFLAGNLKTHLETHSGEKSNKCNQCDYASSQAGTLRRHLKTHSGEKPNKCNQCTMGQAQCKMGNRKMSSMPLILRGTVTFTF